MSLLDTLLEAARFIELQERRLQAGAKRKLLKPDDGRQARNDALTEYYTIKRKLLESKFENIMLENEKLKLEIRKLKGEDIN